MHILLTNDDGVASYGIKALAMEAQKRGHSVSMVAPSSQRSANAHCITIHSPVQVHKLGEPYTCYAVDGTPADCSRIAILSLIKEPIDMVISGINDGFNAGRAIIYSGTCGAAREAVILGKKAIATSIDFNATKEQVDFAAEVTLDMAEKLHSTNIQTKEAYLNINVPALPKESIKAPVMTYISDACPNDDYIDYTSPRRQRYFFLANEYLFACDNEGSDVNMLVKGHITLSFLSIAEDHTILEKDFLNS